MGLSRGAFNSRQVGSDTGLLWLVCLLLALDSAPRRVIAVFPGNREDDGFNSHPRHQDWYYQSIKQVRERNWHPDSKDVPKGTAEQQEDMRTARPIGPLERLFGSLPQRIPSPHFSRSWT